MRLVLDASAAVATVMVRAKTASFRAQIEQADEVLAPDLFVAEVVNTIWKYHQFEHLSVDASDLCIESALQLVDTWIPCRELHREAFLLARASRRPAYDMFYLALARREDASLITADAALRREAQRQGVRVA